MSGGIFGAAQRFLPQHALSRGIGRLAASQITWVKNVFIRIFSAIYGVDLTEADRSNYSDYRSFNDFFTRELKPGARSFPPDDRAIASPADGTISQSGRIEAGTLLQAKGARYSLDALAGELGGGFDGGSFVTIYLAPHNYHRVHTPCPGVLTTAKAVPGALFSVNAATEASIADLFCRNERLVCRLATPHGELLIVLVGALIVASIATPWPGPVSPYRISEIYHPKAKLDRGGELGRFLLGSTVILCAPPKAGDLRELPAGTTVATGEVVGHWNGK